MNRIQQLAHQVTVVVRSENVHEMTYNIRPLVANDRDQVRALLLANGVPLNDAHFDEIILAMYGNSAPSVYYMVAVPKGGDEHVHALGSVFFEDKFTRGGCVTAHIGDIYTVRVPKSDSDRSLRLALTDVLKNSGLTLRPKAYKVSAHAHKEEVPVFVEKLGFGTEDKEVHMVKQAPQQNK